MSRHHRVGRYRVAGQRFLSDDSEGGLAAIFPPRIHVEVVASWPPGTPEGQVNAVVAEVANRFVEELADAESARPDDWSWETG